jgi:hypothetical protein
MLPSGYETERLIQYPSLYTFNHKQIKNDNELEQINNQESFNPEQITNNNELEQINNQESFNPEQFTKRTFYYLKEVSPKNDKTVKNCVCGTKFRFIIQPKYDCSMCGEAQCHKCIKYYPKNLIFSDFPFDKSMNYFINLWGGTRVNLHMRSSMTITWFKVCKKCEENIIQCLLSMYTKQETNYILRTCKLTWQTINFDY